MQQNEFQPLLERTMARHNALKILAILLSVAVFIVVMAINYLGAAADSGIFQNKTGDISNYFYIEITPAGWTFSIWAVIYIWQVIWLVYAMTTICRQKAGTYVYLLPVFPVVLYISFILNNACNIGWLFAFDRKELAIAFPLLFFTAFTLYVFLYFSLTRLYSNLDYLQKNGIYTDIWLIRFLVQNGIAFYAAWVTVATLLNLALVMTYKDGSDITDIGIAQDVSSTVALAILAVELVGWFALDIFALDNYTRYLFSPYVTLTVAMGGVVSKNFDLDLRYRNSIFSVVLLVVAAVFLFVKVTVMIVRHFKGPIKPAYVDFKQTI